MQAQGLTLRVDDGAVALIAKQGEDRAYGARPLRRVVTDWVEDAAADLLLSGEAKPGDTLCLIAEGDRAALRAETPAQQA